MQTEAPSIFINDDEVEFKLIYVRSKKTKRRRKYTISEAERLGLVKVDAGSFRVGSKKYSKAITIKENNVVLCLSTKIENPPICRKI
jgi:hypothetical protein